MVARLLDPHNVILIFRSNKSGTGGLHSNLRFNFQYMENEFPNL